MTLYIVPVTLHTEKWIISLRELTLRLLSSSMKYICWNWFVREVPTVWAMHVDRGLAFYLSPEIFIYLYIYLIVHLFVRSFFLSFFLSPQVSLKTPQHESLCPYQDSNPRNEGLSDWKLRTSTVWSWAFPSLRYCIVLATIRANIDPTVLSGSCLILF